MLITIKNEYSNIWQESIKWLAIKSQFKKVWLTSVVRSEHWHLQKETEGIFILQILYNSLLNFYYVASVVIRLDGHCCKPHPSVIIIIIITITSEYQHKSYTRPEKKNSLDWNSEYVFIEGSGKVAFEQLVVEDCLRNDAADELEVAEMVRVAVGRWIDRVSHAVARWCAEQSVHRIEDLAGNYDVPLAQ